MKLVEDVRATLQDRLEELKARLNAIETSRSREDVLMSMNDDERMSEREHDEVLDRLDKVTHEELEQVQHALQRIEAGTFGICERCGNTISRNRQRAIPEATFCSVCAGVASRG